jgi:hypothetical protein
LSGWRQAADLYQFETECFELGEDPVEGSLIGEKAGQDGVTALVPGAQGRKRQPNRLAQVPADPDLVVALRTPPRPIAARAGHVITAHDPSPPTGDRVLTSPLSSPREALINL